MTRDQVSKLGKGEEREKKAPNWAELDLLDSSYHSLLSYIIRATS